MRYCGMQEGVDTNGKPKLGRRLKHSPAARLSEGKEPVPVTVAEPLVTCIKGSPKLFPTTVHLVLSGITRSTVPEVKGDELKISKASSIAKVLL